MTTRTARTRDRPRPRPVAVAAEAVERELDEEVPDDLIAAELGEIELLEPGATEAEAELTAPEELETEDSDEVDEEAEFEALVEEPEADTEEEEADEHEAGLDELLALQLAPEDYGLDTEIAEPEDEEDVIIRLEAADAVAPARADEFVCRSCFLIRKLTQLGDPARFLCKDCA